jgi:tRNA-dihydrouridine synthase
MIGRGVVGRPWIAREIAAGLAGQPDGAPGRTERLTVVLDHFRESLAFYGERLGLRMFRKHLASYIEAAPWPAQAAERRAARARLCQLEAPGEVEAGLTALWSERNERLAA